MRKIKIAVKSSIKWLIKNLLEIAVLLMITSSLIAISSIYSAEPQDCLFWAWCSLCLACSFVLFRYSLMVKSVKGLLFSLIEAFLIFVVSGHYVFEIQLLPQYTGPGLCTVMLFYYTISLCVIIPEGRHHKWTWTQKTAMFITLVIALLAAVMAISVSRWVIILMLNVATIPVFLFVKYGETPNWMAFLHIRSQ